MSCIYYIFASQNRHFSGGYVGQDDSNEYKRIQDHVLLAYSDQNGWGSEKLIKENSACNLHFCAFDGPNYGISQRTYDLFWEQWGTEGASLEAQKLNLAEIFHIAYHRYTKGDLSAMNVQLGGHGTIPVRYHFSEKDIAGLQNLATDENLNNIWKRDPIELTLSPFNNAKDFNKLIFPVEYRTLEILLQSYLQDILNGAGFRKLLVNWIVDIWNGNLDDNHKQSSLELRITHFFQKDVVGQMNLIVQKAFGTSTNVVFDASDLDIPDISERLSKWFTQRLDLKTVKAAIESIDTKKDIPEQVVDKLQKQITQFGKGTGDFLKIPIPAIDTNRLHVTGSRQVPEWWKSLEEDMANLNLDSHTEDIIPVLKNCSWKSFCSIMDEIDLEIQPGRFNATVYEKENETNYNHSQFERHEIYDAGLIPDALQITLREKVRDQYEKHGIHGGILHFWEIFYRQMVTIWLREKRNRQLVEIEDGGMVKVNNNFQNNGKDYYFLPSTWDAIQGYQNIDWSAVRYY